MKLLVSDFDGTLYKNKSITKSDQMAIKRWQRQGNLFIIATGRDYDTLLKKITPYHVFPDFVIGNNGSTIDKKVLSELKIELSECRKLIEGFDLEFRHIFVSYYKKKEQEITIKLINKIEEINFLGAFKVLQVSFQFYSEKEAALFVRKYQGDIDKVRLIQNIQTVDIISFETDKYQALKALLRQLNILNENVYTIGDGLNDVEMLKHFEGASFKGVSEKVSKSAYHEVEAVCEWIEIINKMDK